MLQSIRDKATGILAYIIIGLLIIPFALFGVYNYFTGGRNPPVATVDGVKITRTELDNAYQRQQAQLRRILGDKYDPSLFNAQHQRRQVLDDLIDQAVLLHFVRRHGFRISDESLRSVIQSTPDFLVDGKFSRERYEAVLRQNGFSPDQYESLLRQDQLIRQLEFGIAATPVLTERDVARFVALEHQARNLSWLKVAATSFRDRIQVDAKAVQDYYDTHKQAFQQPEQVKISYLELSRQDMAEQLKVDEKALRQRYEEIKDSRFTVPAARDVRTLLIKLPKNATQQQVEEARKRIEALRQKIEHGASFAGLARRYSQDAGSAREGGDLGFVHRGDMVKPVGQAAFKLKVGEVSEPIRSRFGWHLIEVKAIRPGYVKPFSGVEGEIRQEMLGQKAAKRYYELSNRVANYAYEHPDSLKPVADKYGLKIQHSDWFSQDGADQGIAANPKVVKAAFSDDVLKQGLNSQSIDLGDDRLVILRVDQHKPSAVLPLEAVQDRIRERLIASRASQQAQTLGAQLLKKVKSGQSLEYLAQGNQHVSYAKVGWVSRGSDKLPDAVIRRSFRLPHPGPDQPSLTGFALPDGDYAIVLLRGVRDGDLSQLNATELSQVRGALRSLDAEATLRSMVHTLRQQADVEINQKQLSGGEGT